MVGQIHVFCVGPKGASVSIHFWEYARSAAAESSAMRICGQLPFRALNTLGPRLQVRVHRKKQGRQDADNDDNNKQLEKGKSRACAPHSRISYGQKDRGELTRG